MVKNIKNEKEVKQGVSGGVALCAMDGPLCDSVCQCAHVKCT